MRKLYPKSVVHGSNRMLFDTRIIKTYTTQAVIKEPTYFYLYLCQKSTDFNAVVTDRFRNEQHMWQYELHLPHVINVATLPCETQNTEYVILHRDITKENCVTCIISSLKWTRVIMYLTFAYLGCYTAKHVWNKDLWHRQPAKTLDANLFWLWPECHQCWHDRLRSCVYAGGRHFERILWPDCSLMWFTRTLYDETANVIWCM